MARRGIERTEKTAIVHSLCLRGYANLSRLLSLYQESSLWSKRTEVGPECQKWLFRAQRVAVSAPTT